jgi:hypothetical protein
VTNHGNEKVENSDEGCEVTAERDFKRCTRLPNDHFKKIPEMACPHHPYPVKHKLRDCTMMKKFMSLVAPRGDDELARERRSRGIVEVTSSHARF